MRHPIIVCGSCPFLGSLVFLPVRSVMGQQYQAKALLHMDDSQITVKKNVVNPASWQFSDQNSPLPLQQHPAYGLALQSFGSTATSVEFEDANKTIGTAMLLHRKFLGAFRFTTLFRGPLWQRPDTPQEVQLACLKKLKALYAPWRWNFLAVLPEEPQSSETLQAYKKAGLRRIMSGFSTAWIDLRADEDFLRASLKGKWRNQLVGAEKSAFTISIGGRKAMQYDWLLEKESTQRDNRRYQATPLGLVPAFVAASTPKSASGVLSVAAIQNRKKIAGALFLLHGNSATYHIGWAGDEARDLNAQNRVLWEGMLALKAKNIRFLDLGGFNTADLAGIARFKLGTGAAPLTLLGAFI